VEVDVLVVKKHNCLTMFFIMLLSNEICACFKMVVQGKKEKDKMSKHGFK